MAPIINMTTPEAVFGNSFLNICAGRNEIPISKRLQSIAVPKNKPYASGHEALLPSAFRGHVPLSYRFEAMLEKTGKVAKEVPTFKAK